MFRIVVSAGLAPLFVISTMANGVQAAEPGFADEVLGRWNLAVEGDDGPYPSWLEIRLRTEAELMGRLVGQFGSVRHASLVTWENDVLTVRVPVQYEGGDGDLLFNASLRDDRLTGRVRMGDGDLRSFRGVRAPTLQRIEAVSWGDPVSLIGDDLGGWRMRNDRHPGCWSVNDGVLAATPPCVDIISEAEFGDFRLQLEFRYPPGSNSGVYLRGRYEVQIQDDHGKALDPLRLGGIYGFIAPLTDAAKPAGEWQSYVIELVGRTVTVVLNGTEIISGQEIPGITGGALDSDEGSPGPLMLQGDHGPIEYRNIVITPGH